MAKRFLTSRKTCEAEQQAIGATYKEYMDIFDQTPSTFPSKTFVKSCTLFTEDKENAPSGQLYTPRPLITLKRAPPPEAPRPNLSKRDKRKSNLKSLGDELKMLQRQRQVSEAPAAPAPPPPDHANSTNLFLCNLASNLSERDLIEAFGRYGPLASVKIMWPRPAEAPWSTNCGFVAFMSRLDAERAMGALRTRPDMRITWGKCVKLPTYPVHIPQELHELYAPPPPSGLPFNAQSTPSKGLQDAVVKVTIPLNRNHAMIIHRVIEFVVREGPQFEALLINLEANNKEYDFLQDYQSPEHVYYRWKLYSILHGDSKTTWSMEPFRMFDGGSIWVPPVPLNYKSGMPSELIRLKELKLSQTQADKLVGLIQNLTLSRESIKDAMTFCLNYQKAIGDSLQCLVDSLLTSSRNPVKKTARLYLLSDVLLNCKLKQIEFPSPDLDRFSQIFRDFHAMYSACGREDKEIFKMKVLKVLRSWRCNGLFESAFLSALQNVFLWGDEDEDDNEPLDGACLLKRSLQCPTMDCLIVKKQPLDMFNPF